MNFPRHPLVSAIRLCSPFARSLAARTAAWGTLLSTVSLQVLAAPAHNIVVDANTASVSSGLVQSIQNNNVVNGAPSASLVVQLAILPKFISDWAV
jgi:hypothetical protein